jgi:hypothetical protein
MSCQVVIRVEWHTSSGGSSRIICSTSRVEAVSSRHEHDRTVAALDSVDKWDTATPLITDKRRFFFRRYPISPGVWLHRNSKAQITFDPRWIVILSVNVRSAWTVAIQSIPIWGLSVIPHKHQLWTFLWEMTIVSSDTTDTVDMIKSPCVLQSSGQICRIFFPIQR